ncbi:MAG: NYN domain-containing protein [Candidatus Paceibacterota bacterium]|jgi:uncharacterized LabA/DUF88 family protein
MNKNNPNKKHNNNFAYIDGANLYNATKHFSWNFNYGHFRVWLEDKYSVKQAYIFLGFIPKHTMHYMQLWNLGYELIFKEVVYSRIKKAKGNCDSDMVVKVMKDYIEGVFDKAIIVSSDGDFAPLVRFLMEKEKIKVIISPSPAKRCSILLKKIGISISYLSDRCETLETRNKKTPDADFPA